ncbi:MAG TPA: ABC transporter permease [Stellaceae bacterium]|nr:ABC transporter permease [Stellaceae bacterium]
MSRGRAVFGSAIVLIYGFILLPLVVIVGVSFNAGSLFDFPPKGLSLRWYDALFAQSSFLHAFLDVSVTVGVATALAATLLGGLAAIALVRFRFPGRGFLEAFFLTPLVVPHILLGAALYLYFARLGLSASLTTLVISHVLIATPYVVRNVAAGLVGLDPAIEEAAVNLGASRLRAFLRVALPQIRYSVVSSLVFAFIVSFSDINVALFVSGPDTTTLPVYLFSQVQWQSDPSIAAASTVQIVLVALVVAGLQKTFRARIGM